MRRVLLFSPLFILGLFGYVVPGPINSYFMTGPGSVPNQAAIVFVSPTPVPTATETPIPERRAAAVRTVVPSATATPAPPTATPLPAGPRQTGKAPAPKVPANSIIVMDGASGEILYEMNAHQRVPPASTTKIMTALIAVERGKPTDVVNARFDPKALDPDSTLMGVFSGDEVTLEDLLYGLMLPSGNDAALVIANHFAGSEEKFADVMNKRAAELGMVNSHFANPHGLDEPDHYSSAYDLTVAARHGYNNFPLFADLARAKERTVRSGSRTFPLYNLNRLLRQYEGGDGVKIGFTEGAGRTTIASASRQGQRVFVGLMNTRDTVTDPRALLDWAFSNFTWPSDARVTPTRAASTP